MCGCACGSPLQLNQNEPVLSQTVAFVEGKCRGWWAQSIFEFSSSNVWENAGRGRLEHCIYYFCVPAICSLHPNISKPSKLFLIHTPKTDGNRPGYFRTSAIIYSPPERSSSFPKPPPSPSPCLQNHLAPEPIRRSPLLFSHIMFSPLQCSAYKVKNRRQMNVLATMSNLKILFLHFVELI